MMNEIRAKIISLYEKLCTTDHKRLLALSIILVVIAAFCTGIYEAIYPAEAIISITKKEPGEGETEISLDVIADEQRYRINMTLPEREYDTVELTQAFVQAQQWVIDHYLGKNPDEKHVSEDLYFADTVPETGIKIRWQPDDYRLIRSDGTISDDALHKAPIETSVTAILVYKDTEKKIVLPVNIVGQKKQNLDIVGVIQEKIEIQKGNDQAQRQFFLPEDADGIELDWYLPNKNLPVKILCFGTLFACLIYFSGEEKKIQKRRERIAGLDQDYPEIVYQMVMLISSGITVRAAWEKITTDYEKQKAQDKEQKPGFEEMVYALKEMRLGIPEIKAYENFGKRCARRSYMRFSALVIQHIRRGAGGMSEIMLREVTESEIIWRENARKAAEEAGMKLLMPLVMLMAVVFAILIIPAFLSMNM